MRNYMITFRSVTPAQRGERLLRQAGIICALQRTPRWMEEQGCGYSLRIRSSDFQRSLAILRQNRVEFRKAYAQTDTDAVEALEI